MKGPLGNEGPWISNFEKNQTLTPRPAFASPPADDTEVTTAGRGASGGGRGGGGKDDADAGTVREDAPAADEEDLNPYADEYNGDFQHDDGTDVGDAGAMGAAGPGQQDFLAVVTPPPSP